MSVTAAIEVNEQAITTESGHARVVFRYRELADAVDAHCPVRDLFANPTTVERRLAIPA